MGTSTAKRHLGIDLLRIISMVMVCVLHSNKYLTYTDISIRITWDWNLAESFCIIAVNLYAMITGYISVRGNWKLERYAELLMQVLFYVVSLFALDFLFWKMGFIQRPTHFCYPAGYWYFNAYTLLFFSIPFLSSFLRQLSQQGYIRLLLLLLLFFPCTNIFYPSVLKDGYNFAWLAIMYVSGAYIRLYGLPAATWKMLALYIICALLTWGLRYTPYGGRAYFYASPLNGIAAFALFACFERLQIKRRMAGKFICCAAPMTFGVYLIQCHEVGWGYLSVIGHHLFSYVGGYSLFLSVAYAICFYLAFSVADWIRIQIFRMLRIQRFAGMVSGGAMKLFQSLERRLLKVLIERQK